MRKLLLLITLLLCITYESFGQQSRVKSYSNGYYDPTNNTQLNLVDSVVFFYSNGRPGVFTWTNTYDLIKCDSFLDYSYGKLSSRVVYSFDGTGNTTQTVTQSTYSGPTIANDSLLTFSYNASGDTTERILQKWDKTNAAWKNDTKYIYTYDASSNLTEYVEQTYTSGQWLNNNKTDYFYTSNRLDSIQNFNWVGSWNANRRRLHNYRTSGIDTFTVLTQSGPIWDSASRVIKYYAAHGPDTVISQVWDYTNHWINDVSTLKSTYTYNTDGNMTNIRYDKWDDVTVKYYERSRSVYSYNSKKAPVSLTGTDWDGSKWINGVVQKIYYEDYYPVSISAIPSFLKELNIYPVPASGIIQVAANFIKPVAFTITVTDVMGRIVLQQPETPTENYHKTLSLDGVAAGTYTLQIKTAEATQSRQFIIR